MADMAPQSCNLEIEPWEPEKELGNPASRETNHGSARVATGKRKQARGEQSRINRKNIRLEDYIQKDAASISVKILRCLLPMLFSLLCSPQPGKEKNESKWVKPFWWPSGSFFGDPNNSKAKPVISAVDVHGSPAEILREPKPGAKDLRSMFTVLQQKYFEKCDVAPGHCHAVPSSEVAVTDSAYQRDNVGEQREPTKRATVLAKAKAKLLGRLEDIRIEVETMGDTDWFTWVDQITEGSREHISRQDIKQVMNLCYKLEIALLGEDSMQRLVSVSSILTGEAAARRLSRSEDILSQAMRLSGIGAEQGELGISEDTPPLDPPLDKGMPGAWNLDTIPGQLLDSGMTGAWNLDTILGQLLDSGMPGAWNLDTIPGQLLDSGMPGAWNLDTIPGQLLDSGMTDASNLDTDLDQLLVSGITDASNLDTIPSQLLDSDITDALNLDTICDTDLDQPSSIDQEDTPAAPQPGARPPPIPPPIPSTVSDLQDSWNEDESTYERPSDARGKAVKRRGRGGDGEHGAKRQRTSYQ